METNLDNIGGDSLAALARASAAINSTLDLDVVLNEIASSAAVVMMAEAGSVLTFDSRVNKLVFAAASGGHGAELLGQTFDAEKGIAGRVLKTGEAIKVDDVSDDPDFFGRIDEQTHFHTRGVLAAPMVYRSKTVGVLEVINRADGGTFADSDLELLQTFANLAAAAAHNAKAHQDLKLENRALRGALPADGQIIGSSAAIAKVLEMAQRVAPTNATALLLGETGTGKELLGRAIHQMSKRSGKAFVAVNCAALTETLLESELFGHERGSFTGAVGQHTGRFELADGGTLFLDEIGEISASTQVKLLRVLQERCFTRVGGTKTIHCDVRVMAATHRDLKAEIAEGRFREDLFYRLNVFPIDLPALRDRRKDIKALAEHFTQQATVELGVGARSLAPETIEVLEKYNWPGNIRELDNVIERAVLMCDGDVLLPDHLPAEIAAGDRSGPPPLERWAARAKPPRPTTLPENEREMIVEALRDNFWNQTQAAATLGISRDNLRYRIKKYDIRRDR